MATNSNKKPAAKAPVTKGGVMTSRPTSRPANYQPEKRKAQAETQRHMSERPAVTPSNMVRYSDPSKRFEKEFGVGAKLAAPGTDLRRQQDAAAREKVMADKARNGYWNVEDVNRPLTQGGVIINKDRTPLKNSTIDRLSSKKQ